MSALPKIGFMGAGKMAQAMAKGFIASGLTKWSDIAVCDPVPQCQDVFKSLGAEVVPDNVSVVSKSSIVFLSVKPVAVPKVLKEVSSISADKLFVSIAMGVPIKSMELLLASRARVIRVMPNTPMLVRKGASVLVRGSRATDSDVRVLKQLLGSVGICEEAPEAYLDAVTALSGSGPAYVFVLIEALADGAVKMGLPRDLAYKLAAQTVLGAGELVQQTARHPGQLKDDVTSPAGSTAAGLYVLEKNNFRYAVQGAVEAATLKCQEISEGTK